MKPGKPWETNSIFSRLDPVRSYEELEWHLKQLLRLKSGLIFHKIPIPGRILSIGWDRIYCLGWPPVQNLYILRCTNLKSVEEFDPEENGNFEWEFRAEKISDVFGKIRETLDLALVEEVIEE